MAQAHAMSDDQVAGELKKMCAFIRQEAHEKAREINLKADEEHAIERSKLVRTEIMSIDTSYEKRFKTASMSQQITRSTVANKTRLRVLSARQQLLDDLFEQTSKRLADTSKDKTKYQELLKNLLLEGLYALNEPKVQVRARKSDYDILKKAIDQAQKEYKDKVGEDTHVDIDEKNPHPDGSAGGLSIIGGGGKIDINNTLEERLKLLETDALPFVRVTLFGENQNRKFRD